MLRMFPRFIFHVVDMLRMFPWFIFHVASHVMLFLKLHSEFEVAVMLLNLFQYHFHFPVKSYCLINSILALDFILLLHNCTPVILYVNLYFVGINDQSSLHGWQKWNRYLFYGFSINPCYVLFLYLFIYFRQVGMDWNLKLMMLILWILLYSVYPTSVDHAIWSYRSCFNCLDLFKGESRNPAKLGREANVQTVST